MSINIEECTICQTRYFPARLMCRVCSNSNFRTVEVSHGRVQETTRLSNGSTLATVQVGDDVRIIARVHPEVRLDDEVELIDGGSIEPCQAYVPTRGLPQ